jgi:hypothetical protein
MGGYGAVLPGKNVLLLTASLREGTRGPYHVEPLRQVKVQLDSGALPFSPDRIFDLDVDLGAIEGAPTLIHLPT